MISKYLKKIGERSKVAALNIVKVDIKKRNKVLDVFSKEISRNKKKIINENIKDIKTCKREELIDRLLLDEKKINQFRKGEIDEWRNVLPKNLIQKIEKKFEKQMKELGYL